MSKTVQRLSWGVALLSVFLPALPATTIPRLTFEQLTDASDVIASGKVTRSWAAWDSEHKYIWTHYELTVSDTAKGSRASTVEFAEPGGAIGDKVMAIAGTVMYGVGDQVVIFLSRMPNGYLRTTGWAQGKYTMDAQGMLHSHAAIGAEVIEAGPAPKGVSLRSLEGISFGELKVRVAQRTGAGRVQ